MLGAGVDLGAQVLDGVGDRRGDLVGGLRDEVPARVGTAVERVVPNSVATPPGITQVTWMPGCRAMSSTRGFAVSACFAAPTAPRTR